MKKNRKLKQQMEQLISDYWIGWVPAITFAFLCFCVVKCVQQDAEIRKEKVASERAANLREQLWLKNTCFNKYLQK